MKKYISFIATGFAIITCFGQSVNTEKLDAFFKSIEDNNKGMGSVSLFQNGEEVYHNSIGFSELENNIKANAFTKYRIGSITKMFTATIIMQMIDQKKITLDQTIENFFPTIPNAKQITIKQLLGHRSGLYNLTNKEDYLKWCYKPINKEELIEKIIENGTVFQPNEKAEYSNTNYILLTFIAENIDKKPFSKILHKRIVKKLKLKNTFVGSKINNANNEANSYGKVENWNKSPETDMSIPLGAGNIVSNAKDLNTFINALYNNKLVSKSSLEIMKTIKEGYGLGMFEIPFHDKKGLGHTGGIDNFLSQSFYFPKEDFSITYLSNGTDLSTNDIAIGVLSIYFGMEYTLPEFKTIKLSKEELNGYVGTYKSKEMPLEIKIFIENEKLKAQATGQSAFQLEAKGNHIFKFDPAGIKIEFNEEQNKFTLQQGGGTYKFNKK